AGRIGSVKMRRLERWLLLALGFVSIGLGEELLTGVLEARVASPWARALVIMVVVGVAYTLAAEVLAPRVRKSIRKVHGAVKPGRGAAAGVIGAAVLLAAAYVGYYFTYR
ncbi:MAG: hypothetical protein ACYTGB_11640, partial [Planctomycetota bacterium]